VVQVGSIEHVDNVIAGREIGDLALVSVSFGAPTARLINGLRRIGWRRVIALIPNADLGALTDALDAGATGILLDRDGKSSTLDPPSDPPGVRALSDKEIEVIRLVADGQTNREIGRNLLLSSLTVKSHLARISHKLGAGDRAQIAVIAMRAGVID